MTTTTDHSRDDEIGTDDETGVHYCRKCSWQVERHSRDDGWGDHVLKWIHLHTSKAECDPIDIGRMTEIKLTIDTGYDLLESETKGLSLVLNHLSDAIYGRDRTKDEWHAEARTLLNDMERFRRAAVGLIQKLNETGESA